MANVRLTWGLPAAGASQRPIAAVRVEINADPTQLPWTEQATIDAAAPQELLFSDVPAGEQFYRAIAIDEAGAEDPNPPQTSVDVPFDLPGSVTNLTATIE